MIRMIIDICMDRQTESSEASVCLVCIERLID